MSRGHENVDFRHKDIPVPFPCLCSLPSSRPSSLQAPRRSQTTCQNQTDHHPQVLLSLCPFLSSGAEFRSDMRSGMSSEREGDPTFVLTCPSAYFLTAFSFALVILRMKWTADVSRRSSSASAKTYRGVDFFVRITPRRWIHHFDRVHPTSL